MPSNSEAIGAIIILFFFLSVPVPELHVCVVYNSGTGYEDGQYPFVPYNRAVLPCINLKTTKLLIFVFSFDLNNKLNDSIVGSLVRSTCKSSYMEVSSETSDDGHMAEFSFCQR